MNNCHCGFTLIFSSVIFIHSQSLEHRDLGSKALHMAESASTLLSCLSNLVNSAWRYSRFCRFKASKRLNIEISGAVPICSANLGYPSTSLGRAGQLCTETFSSMKDAILLRGSYRTREMINLGWAGFVSLGRLVYMNVLLICWFDQHKDTETVSVSGCSKHCFSSQLCQVLILPADPHAKRPIIRWASEGSQKPSIYIMCIES